MSERRVAIIVGIAAAASLALLGRESNPQTFEQSNESRPVPQEAVIPAKPKEKDLLTTKNSR